MEAKKRNLEAADYVYKGVFYGDGVVENGVKIMPKINKTTANATNLFKRSLFRVECKQSCDQNKKMLELIKRRNMLDATFRKVVQDAGGEEHGNQPLLMAMKEQIQVIDKQIVIVREKQKKQEAQNAESLRLQLGQKVNYGTPIQLKHLFSSGYLTVDHRVTSQEYGCRHACLSQTTEASWFTFEPTVPLRRRGQVVNFNDYFYLKSFSEQEVAYLHVFVKPEDEYNDTKMFRLNVSLHPSPFRAKLFESHKVDKNKKGLSNFI